MRDGVRRVTEVVEVSHMEGETIALNPLFDYRYLGENAGRQPERRVRACCTQPRFLARLGYYGLADAFLATLGAPKARAA